MEDQAQTGSLAAALAHAERLLALRPALAAEQAREILKVVPGDARASLLLGLALRAEGRTGEALAALEPLAAAHPNAPDVQCALGETLAEAGRLKEADAALRQAIRVNGKHPRAHRALGDVLTALGDGEGADAAYAKHIEASVREPRLMQAAAALVANDLPVAEHVLRAFLKENPTDVTAIRMLAELASRLGRNADAEKLLVRCLELAPGFEAARHNYAVVLSRSNRNEEALAEIEILLAADPRNPAYRALEAATMARIGEYDRTIEAYEAMLKVRPDQAKAWMSYGHALKTVGRTEDGIAAYRKSIALKPNLGEAYWSLANLKTFRFTDGDLAAMRAQLTRSDISDDDRLHLNFALGKALEDAGEYEPSFAHYVRGNALRRDQLGYRAQETTDEVDRSIATFTPEFFAERQGVGCVARDPIFIVGLPRSGSTLLEQILASHSQVEGTMELPDLSALARSLPRRKGEYPGLLAELPLERFAELGEAYLSTTRVQRKTGRPIFIDKMPANWLHAGFIRLILPNAKIIDARRHPLACCFSNFKQHFARGQGFAYSLADLGLYYRDYVRLMDHFDRVIPGRVHRVDYERTVSEPEETVRDLLTYCGLPFEEACLRFYENRRAVRTASSEQVRQPIFSEGLDQWRRYELWLDELKITLGEVLTSYPGLPTPQA